MALEKMADTKPPVSEADVKNVEAELGITLPGEYRQFLLKYNGGRPEPPGFRFGEGAYSDSQVQTFNCILPDDYKDLRSQAEVFKGRIPDNLLPIAKDPFGNVISIGVSGDVAGEVHFWDHETSDVYLVAPSFNEFLNRLEPVKE